MTAFCGLASIFQKEFVVGASVAGLQSLGTGVFSDPYFTGLRALLEWFLERRSSFEERRAPEARRYWQL